MTYDAEAWDSKVIHFSGDCHDSRGEGSKNRRPLIHFYAFMMHADALVDARVKRFARDRLRYRDSIFCKASQVGFVRRLVASLWFLSFPSFAAGVWVCFFLRTCACMRGKKKQKVILASSIHLSVDVYLVEISHHHIVCDPNK